MQESLAIKGAAVLYLCSDLPNLFQLQGAVAEALTQPATEELDPQAASQTSHIVQQSAAADAQDIAVIPDVDEQRKRALQHPKQSPQLAMLRWAACKASRCSMVRSCMLQARAEMMTAW